VISKTHRQLIATHRDAQMISLFDLAVMAPRGTIELGFRPDHIQLDDATGVVALAGRDEGRLALVALDGGRVTATIDGLTAPADLIFDRTGERLFVASGSSSHIDIVDVAAGTLAGRIELDADGQGVQDLARTPGGKIGIALHGDSGLISGLDLVAATQVASSRIPGPAERAFPSANSQLFLVPNAQDRSVSMISSWTYKAFERLPAPGAVLGINFGMFDMVALALDGEENQARAWNLTGDQRGSTAIDLPGRPATGLSVEAGTKLYIALSDSDQVAIIDIAQRKLTGVIDDVVAQPWAVNAAGGLSYCH
jgi:YVTN family beta-propeller protein